MAALAAGFIQGQGQGEAGRVGAVTGHWAWEKYHPRIPGSMLCQIPPFASGENIGFQIKFEFRINSE